MQQVSVLDVYCPECLAAPGEPCVSGFRVEDGQLYSICSSTHEERKQKAVVKELE